MTPAAPAPAGPGDVSVSNSVWPMYKDYLPIHRSFRNRDPATLWLAGGLGALLGVAAITFYQVRGRNRVSYRPPDDAPVRAARRQRGRATVTGRTITIDRPRSEIYAFWRDFGNLARVMENVRDVSVEDGVTRWTIRGPAERDVTILTTVTEEVGDERIEWRSTDASQIEHRGRVILRDAPAGRGTEVTLDLEYLSPGGELGRFVAKALQAEPHLQARRDLKRLKMLLETGEIATNANRRSAA